MNSLRNLGLLFLYFLTTTTPLLGQSGYIGETFQSTFSPLTGGQALTKEAWDDPNLILPVGFEFELFGEPNSLLFTGGFLGGFLLGNPDTVNNEFDLIAVLWPDLVDRGYFIDSAMSPLLIETSGEAGDRVFTMEWRNTGLYESQKSGDGIILDFINIQLRIFEADDAIEIHFGQSRIDNPSDYLNAEPGVAIGLIYNASTLTETLDAGLFVEGLASDPEYIEVSSFDDIPGLSSFPPENTVYRFTPIASSTDEIGTLEDITYYSPNPVSNSLMSLIPDSRVFDLMSIYDSQGRLLLQSAPPPHIDMTSFAPGQYTFVFNGSERQAMQRIVKL